jgi:integrase
MPAQKRFQTDYPGVYYIMGRAIATGKPEKIFYIDYRKDGKRIQEKAGRQFQDDMTPARAARIRAGKIEGRELPNVERRTAEQAAKEAESNKWTLDRLFQEYIKSRPDNSAKKIDIGRYKKYLKIPFGGKEPHELVPLEVDRLRIKLLKTLSPQSVKHILSLLNWTINFGADKNLCSGLSFRIKKPSVSNEKTEDLTPEQLERLLKAIDEDPCLQAGTMMKMALYTGMRRGEMFKLKWDDVDFQRGFILIRDPKGGKDQKIPLNDAARALLERHPRMESEYVFPGRGGRRRTDVNHQLTRIKEAAGLPKDFRALHGLRHVYASMLASSGQVDMYTLQRLLTHKSPVMTQRYAHLRDDALKRAADVAGDIIGEIANGAGKADVVDLGKLEK